MRLLRYLKEALKPSQFRMFKDDILSKKYKTFFNEVFKGKDRIYLPFEGKVKIIKIPKGIESFLQSNNLEIVDYAKGIVKAKNKNRLLKLGKLLKKKKELHLLKIFINDKNRTVGKKSDLLIVISRHPYDIAGMSTGRGWTSCMDLEKGEFCSHVNKDIEHGTIIAYVIDSTDKNINKPMARLLMKPFINMKNPKDIVLYPEEVIYGASVPNFRNILVKWLKSWQKYKGTYKLNVDMYEDDIPEFIGTGDKTSDDWEVRKLYYDGNPKDKDAKKDDDRDIRFDYYSSNPNDKDAKKDEYWFIRNDYYKNHPKDKDAKKDKNSDIRKSYYKRHPEEK